MESEKAKLGGGAGGGPHDDTRDVNGTWRRNATQNIGLFATGAADGHMNSIRISAGNRGESNGGLLLDAGTEVVVATGEVKIHAEQYRGVTIAVDDTAEEQIMLSRGDPFAGSSLQSIVIAENGVTISAMTGSISLAVGENLIQISSTGIVIKGTLVQIN